MQQTFQIPIKDGIYSSVAFWMGYSVALLIGQVSKYDGKFGARRDIIESREQILLTERLSLF